MVLIHIFFKLVISTLWKGAVKFWTNYNMKLYHKVFVRGYIEVRELEHLEPLFSLTAYLIWLSDASLFAKYSL